MFGSGNTQLHIANFAVTTNFVLGLVELASLPGDSPSAGDIVVFIIYFIND
jgi:hypothetical protein